MTGGVDLTELKNDMTILKGEMIVVRKDVEDLRSKTSVLDASRSPLANANSDEPKFIKTLQSETATASDSAVAVSSGVNAGPNAGELSRKEKSGVSTSESSKKFESKTSVSRQGSGVTGEDGIIEHFDDVTVAQCMEAISNVEAIHSGLIQNLNTRVTDLEKEVGCVTEKITSQGHGANSIAKIQAIEANIEKINETISRLMDDKENRDINTNVSYSSFLFILYSSQFVNRVNPSGDH